MKSILQRLYDGEISPNELIMPRGSEYRSLLRKIGEEKAYFKGILSEEEYRRFEELDDLYSRSCSMDSKASFCYGFRLGSCLMIEVFTEKEELISSKDL